MFHAVMVRMFRKWHRRIALGAIKSRLPFIPTLRRWKRRLNGYEPHPANIGSTLDDLTQLYRLMHTHGRRFHGTVLEIGTGWFPVAGIVARLAGADRVILTDIVPNMDNETFLTAVRIVIEQIDDISKRFDLDPDTARSFLERARIPADLAMIYNAPMDLMNLPDGSLDIVMSRACLEHIPVSELKALMALLFGKIREGGIMAHAIDNSDHLAQVDPTISRLNFLTWTTGKHRVISYLRNGGENRLRHHEYANLFRQAGYSLIASEAFIPENVLSCVPSLRLVEPYSSMTAEQLAAVTSWYVVGRLPAAV